MKEYDEITRHKTDFFDGLDKILSDLKAERQRLTQLASTLNNRNYAKDIADIIKTTYRQLGKTE